MAKNDLRWQRTERNLMAAFKEELDPHSVYIPASEMQAVNEPLQGKFDGIGIVFNMAPDTV